MIDERIMDKLSDDQIDEVFRDTVKSCDTHLKNAMDLLQGPDAALTHVRNALYDVYDMQYLYFYEMPEKQEKPWWKIW